MGRRYRLLSPVGRGGMGMVWHAHDVLLDRDVAVKELILPFGLDHAGKQVAHRRMLREARSAARLSHPGIVTVHDVVEEDGRPWIVMELVRAWSLEQAVRQSGPLPVVQAAEIGVRVLDGLRHAHAAGILHRDVKPGNVLLTADRVVLTDFGIAAIEGDVTITQTGLLMGSPAYIPPERLQGRPITHAADLWSFGATLYAAVEGRPPYEGPDAVAVLGAVLTQEPNRPQRAGALLPIIEGLLRKNPADRMPAAQAADLLERVLRTHGSGLSPRGERPGSTPLPTQGDSTPVRMLPPLDPPSGPMPSRIVETPSGPVRVPFDPAADADAGRPDMFRAHVPSDSGAHSLPQGLPAGYDALDGPTSTMTGPFGVQQGQVPQGQAARPSPYDALRSPSGPQPNPYDAMRSQSGPQPDPYDAVRSQSGPLPDPYDALRSTTGPQPEPYNTLRGASGGQPNPYDALRSQTGPQPGPYESPGSTSGPQPGPYNALNSTSGPYEALSGPSGPQPGPYEGLTSPSGPQPNPYDALKSASGPQPLEAFDALSGNALTTGPHRAQTGPHRDSLVAGDTGSRVWPARQGGNLASELARDFTSDSFAGPRPGTGPQDPDTRPRRRRADDDDDDDSREGRSPVLLVLAGVGVVGVVAALLFVLWPTGSPQDDVATPPVATAAPTDQPSTLAAPEDQPSALAGPDDQVAPTQIPSTFRSQTQVGVSVAVPKDWTASTSGDTVTYIGPKSSGRRIQIKKVPSTGDDGLAVLTKAKDEATLTDYAQARLESSSFGEEDWQASVWEYTYTALNNVTTHAVTRHITIDDKTAYEVTITAPDAEWGQAENRQTMAILWSSFKPVS
ncbi:protein kinase domain-containing protein [Sphaerisporangium corydalis]|uniref:non-specific serine/threonine protein kinase n=1 Tax=Sphaerisporangium corydalis TaxID=1441875 RepID=A0ABV9ENL1_9ACTN|nr:protein kinase [Sphaerisporangium corydalis]